METLWERKEKKVKGVETTSKETTNFDCLISYQDSSVHVRSGEEMFVRMSDLQQEEGEPESEVLDKSDNQIIKFKKGRQCSESKSDRLKTSRSPLSRMSSSTGGKSRESEEEPEAVRQKTNLIPEQSMQEAGRSAAAPRVALTPGGRVNFYLMGVEHNITIPKVAQAIGYAAAFVKVMVKKLEPRKIV